MLARWLAVLSSGDFETQHCKRAIHSNADGLSRQAPRKCKKVTVRIVHWKVNTVFVL